MNTEILGQRVSGRRQQLGLSAAQVAQAAGTTRDAIYKLEAGERRPNALLLARVAQALATSSDYLCGMTDNPASVEAASAPTDSPDIAALVADLNGLDPATRAQVLALVRAALALRRPVGGEPVSEPPAPVALD